MSVASRNLRNDVAVMPGGRVPGARGVAKAKQPKPSPLYEPRTAVEYVWGDVAVIGSIGSINRMLYATTDGNVWVSAYSGLKTNITDSYGHMRFGLSVVVEDENHHPVVLEPTSKDRLLEYIAERCQQAAVEKHGIKAKPRGLRPISKDWSLTSLLAYFDRHGISLTTRNGLPLLAWPRGEYPTSIDLRHALESLKPLLTAHAEGKPLMCAEKGCPERADTLAYPQYPICQQHADLVIQPMDDVVPLPWWEVFRVTFNRPDIYITPAGVEVLGIGQPAEGSVIRNHKDWRKPAPKGFLDRLRKPEPEPAPMPDIV